MASHGKSSALSSIFNKHSLVHWTLMLGMVLPMVVAASPAGAATLGDLAVQTFHMLKSMVTGLVSGFPAAIDMAGNALHGKFAAHSFSQSALHTAAAAAVMDPAGHATATAAGGLKSAFASRSEWFFSLPGPEQLKLQEAANMFGMPIEQYTKGWTGADKLPLPGNW